MTLLSSLVSPLDAGIYQRFQFAPAQGATSVSGADANGNTLSYKPGYVEVMRNGMLLPLSDYTATNGTSIVFSNGMNAGDTVYVIALSTFSVAQAVSPLQMTGALQGYIAGLTLSSTGPSTTFSVASGSAMDSTNVDYLTLLNSISKTTSAWAAGSGNGAMDTGAVAASTWYHVYVIKNVSIPLVDILFSLSATSPTLPTGYTEFRRIGSMKTNGSSQWTPFTQNGNEFLWITAVADANGVTLPTSGTSLTVTVPTGIEVWAKFTALLNASSSYVNFYGLDRSVPVVTGANYASLASNASGNQSAGEFAVRTNTSAQIGVIGSNASGTYYLGTFGWIDNRGFAGAVGAGPLSVGQQIAPLQRGYLGGLTLSTAGSSATFSVAVGQANDSTNVDVMTLGSAFSKTTGAWVVGSGNGGIDTGAVATSTWYHVHLIKNPTNGAVDVLFSLSATAPTLPSGYTLFRRIGSMKTNGSSQWTKFTQNGDEFTWDTPVGDVQAGNAVNGSTTVTMTVPAGIIVNWLGTYYVGSSASAGNAILTPLDISAPTASSSAFDLTFGSSVAGMVKKSVRTNTSAQIRRTENVATASNVYMVTDGWIDRRGRDA